MNSSCCIFPGSFSPPTLGHEHVLAQASRLFSRVVVVIAKNYDKNYLFSSQERLDFVEQMCLQYSNVQVEIFTGLLSDYIKNRKIFYIVRGIRNHQDFSCELNLSWIYQKQSPDLQTVWIPVKQEFAHISSKMVCELLCYQADITQFVPKSILKTLTLLMRQKQINFNETNE